jgi:hypothetical protein
MNYPVTHRLSVEGHPCWPFRWEHERASDRHSESQDRETGLGPKDEHAVPARNAP